MKSERARMLAGDLYDPLDAELVTEIVPEGVKRPRPRTPWRPWPGGNLWRLVSQLAGRYSD